MSEPATASMVLSWIYGVTALVSVLAAVLAWVAKIRWSNEYRDAKEAEISALKQQISLLERLTKQQRSVSSSLPSACIFR